MSRWGRTRAGMIRVLEVLVIVMVIALTLTVLWGVFTRFVLGHQAPFTDELARVLLVWVSMIGASLAFALKSHLGVDYLVIHMDPGAARIVAAAVQVIIMILAVIVFIAGGWGLAMAQMQQELPTLRPLTRGMVYLALPLAGLFIFTFAAEQLAAVLARPAAGGETPPASKE